MVMRVAAVTFAALLLGAQLVTRAHEAAVAHHVCEHGEITHAVAQQAATPGRWAPLADRLEHSHGCALVLFGHQGCDVDPPAGDREAVAIMAWRVERDAVSPRRPLAVAPSRSPPA